VRSLAACSGGDAHGRVTEESVVVLGDVELGGRSCRDGEVIELDVAHGLRELHAGGGRPLIVWRVV
jgi:hypothetical protein